MASDNIQSERKRKQFLWVAGLHFGNTDIRRKKCSIIAISFIKKFSKATVVCTLR